VEQKMIKLTNQKENIFLTEKELQEQLKNQGWIYEEDDWGRKKFIFECKDNPITTHKKCLHKKCVHPSELGDYCWQHTNYIDNQLPLKKYHNIQPKIKLSRINGQPNSDTYLIPPIKKLLDKYVLSNKNWIDPFAGDGDVAYITNDIDSNSKAQYHIDALHFLNKFTTNSIRGILLNPPYSFHQTYTFTKNNKTIYISPIDAIYKQVDRILQKNGLVIHFGWNSNGIGKEYGYIIKEILIIARGKHHNDLIATVERKIT
jgi:hypothetical protein